MAEPSDQQVLDNPVATDWRSGIAEDDRSITARFNTVGDLAKGYNELSTAYSDTVKLPTEKSPPEEVRAFYQKQGCPDTSDGYNRPQLPEGDTYDEDLIGGMQTAAFEEGITDKQFGKLIERYLAVEVKKAEAKEVEDGRVQEETTRALKELWHVDYDKNIEVARRAMRELVTGDLVEPFKTLIEESGLGNNPVFIRGFQEIGSKILNDTFVKSDSTTKLEADYTPAYPNSPEMYRNAEDEEGKKGRAWHEKQGHIY